MHNYTETDDDMDCLIAKSDDSSVILGSDSQLYNTDSNVDMDSVTLDSSSELHNADSNDDMDCTN